MNVFAYSLFLGCLLLSTNTYAKIKKPIAKSKIPVSAKDTVFSFVSSQSSEEEHTPPKDLTLPWPKKLPPAVKNIFGIEAEIRGGSPQAFFSLVRDLPKTLLHGEHLLASVKFSLTFDTSTSNKLQYTSTSNKLQYTSTLIVTGYRNDSKRKVTLWEIPLVVNVTFAPKLECETTQSILAATPVKPSANVSYQCKNTGHTDVVLSNFLGSCGTTSGTWSLPQRFSLRPEETQTFVSKVTLPTKPYQDYTCALSFSANGLPLKMPTLVATIRTIPSFTTLTADKNPTALKYQENGTYHLAFPITPADESELISLRFLFAEPVTLKEVKSQIQGSDPDSFQVGPVVGNNISVRFSPKQTREHQAKAILAVSYEDSTHHWKQETVILQMQGTSVVTKQVVLKKETLDIHKGKEDDWSQDFCSKGWLSQFLDKNKISIPESKGVTTFVRWKTTRWPQSDVCWPKNLTAKPSWHFLPPTQEGAINVYTRYAEPNALYQTTLPITLQYQPKPPSWVLNAQFAPAADTLSSTPWLSARLGMLYQWTYPAKTKDGSPIRRTKRILHQFGGEWIMGTLYHSPEQPITSQPVPFRWDRATALLATYKVGGDVTAQQNIALFFHASMGWSAQEQRYLQQGDWKHSVYLELGAEAKIRLSKKIPGLYMLGGVTMGVSLPATQLWVTFPVGLGLEL